MPNIIDSIQLSGVTYTIQGSGGGKSVEAGRGIDVASGTSAYTVSFNLPISAGTGSNSIAEGYGTFAYGNYSHAEGYQTFINSSYSHAEGYLTSAGGNYSHAEGNFTVTNNQSEHASGQYNVSNKANNTFGNSGNTLFSVGNGPAYNARHNAFEIRQNGDIYLSSGGTDIKLQDHLGGGNPTVELTQSAYDALVQAGTVDPNTYYIITDATPVDMSQYWTSAQTQSAITEATSGKVDTSAITSSVTSASTDSEIPTAKAVFDAIPTGGTGGGKAISAGTNISVTTGETADTINCTLPIKTNAWNSLTFNSSRNPLQVLYASAFGDYTTASGNGSFSIGKDTTASGDYSFVGGYNYSQAKGNESFSFGDGTVANKNASVAFGRNITTNNECEFSCGKLNKSVSASTTFGNSGNTLFSVGNGISSYHNAFEIRQNGDIYCSDGTNDVKLQDTITATAANTTALGGLKLVKLTQSEYDNLSTKDNSTLYVIVN